MPDLRGSASCTCPCCLCRCGSSDTPDSAHSTSAHNVANLACSRVPAGIRTVLIRPAAVAPAAFRADAYVTTLAASALRPYRTAGLLARRVLVRRRVQATVLGLRIAAVLVAGELVDRTSAEHGSSRRRAEAWIAAGLRSEPRGGSWPEAWACEWHRGRDQRRAQKPQRPRARHRSRHRPRELVEELRHAPIRTSTCRS